MNKEDKVSMRKHLAECTKAISRIKTALSKDDLSELRRAVHSLESQESQIKTCFGFIIYKTEIGL